MKKWSDVESDPISDIELMGDFIMFWNHEFPHEKYYDENVLRMVRDISYEAFLYGIEVGMNKNRISK